MSNENIKEQQFLEKVPGLLINAFLKAMCFDAITNVGLGGSKVIAQQPFKVFLATSIYLARDLTREWLPNDYKWAAIGIGFGAGGIKDYFGKGKLSTTALNNAAYEVSKYFLNGTRFDDWLAGPIIESLESVYAIETKTWEVVIKTTFENTGAVTLGNNLYIAFDGYMKSISNYLEFHKNGEDTCNPFEEYYLVDSSYQCLSVL